MGNKQCLLDVGDLFFVKAALIHLVNDRCIFSIDIFESVNSTELSFTASTPDSYSLQADTIFSGKCCG